MAEPVKNGKAQEFETNRQWQRQVELWEADDTPLELQLADVVRVRIWDGVDGSTPYVLVESDDSPNANDSTIDVDDLGDEGTDDDPATVTIVISADDAALVPATTTTTTAYLEITLARAADTDAEAVVHRCALNVKGSPV